MPSEKKRVKCGQLLSGINPGKPVAGGWQHTKCPKAPTTK
jgi:hypothetical protein